ncbi:MAG TPA: LLM class flavin-dependent oxidoreductase, partial [Acidimicrobiales bacterium]
MRFCQSLMYAPARDWVELTRCAEQVGFHQVSLSDHVFYPSTLSSHYPYSPDGRPVFEVDQEWPDVWVMTGALAAVTRRILFSTHVYVLPARNPFVVAKAVGTAAWASGDRVLLGIGAGWMREEFDALEQPFEG